MTPQAVHYAARWRWLVACFLLIHSMGAGGATAQTAPTTRPAESQRKYERAKGIELARPGTLQEYIDKYTGNDVGCTIGGQTFRNFKLVARSSVDESKLEGEHPCPPMTADQILITPVNYVKDGRRWIGFRWTNGPDGWTILGGDKMANAYPYKKGHEIRNAGFTTNYDIRFEVHGTSKWQLGKIGYTGLKTDRLVDGEWSEEKNTGPGSRGNLGWYPRKIGTYGGYGGVNPKTPQSGAWARLSSVSRALPVGAKAPTSNENWFLFPDEEKAPLAFEIRAGQWAEYDTEAHTPHLYSYGMWFRMNCWEKTHTRWHADYIEWGFSNATLTDEVWTADGKNKAAPPPPLPTGVKITEKIEPIKPSGETVTLDCGNGVDLKLVQIPAGKFVMGSPNDETGRCDNEGPQRVVTISKPFFMGVTEVTQAQFQAVTGGGPGSKFAGPNNPVDNIRRASAEKFCAMLSAKSGRVVRLPTEAEWEYAARAGTNTRYCFGDDEKQLPEYGLALVPGGKSTSAVAQKKPNAWGLYDMHGNVWEWCSDWYAADYVGADAVDPKGPASGEAPVLRGGSWAYPAEYNRSASRLLGSPNDIADGGTSGFRIVVE